MLKIGKRLSTTRMLMSSTKKNLVMYGIVLFVFPLLMILVLETFLAVLHNAIGSKYFEDRLETNHQAGLDVRREFKSGPAISNTAHTIRIAVFGGSSAAGYASPISFAELLGNSDFSGRDIEVHNFARSGEPFVGFQAELLKAVMPDYDVILVYAGHNEVWQQIYSRARTSPTPIVLPNGYRIPFGSAPYADLERRLKRLDTAKSGLVRGDAFRKVTNLLADKSRLFWLANRLIYKALAVIPVFDPDRKQNYTPRFFYDSDFITPAERNLLVDQFKKTIQEIAEKLRPDQTMVLSTVLANDLFPPLAEVASMADSSVMERNEQVAKRSYASLAAGDYVALMSEVQDLPAGAHRTYLEAAICLEKSGFGKSESGKCLYAAQEARRLDSLPFRVVPEINTFIRGYKGKNVVVVDPANILSEVPRTASQYHEYFVDFQHPSAKGHFIIADAVLQGLFPEYRGRGASKVDGCGNIELVGESRNNVIRTNRVVQEQQFDTNIKWLDNFIASQPSPYPYNLFKQRAEVARASCLSKAA